MLKINRFLLLCLVLVSLAVQAAPNKAFLLQMLDYVAVDYPEAVEQARVINQAEYQEMIDFADTIGDLIRQLDDKPVRSELVGQAGQLRQLIDEKASATDIASLVTLMRKGIIDNYRISVVPRQAPDLSKAEDIYNRQCASCHGETGYGDGAAGVGLEPAPTDFRDRERQGLRTLYGLFNTITMGVEDTGMVAYSHLSDHDRWSLAFYLGQLAAAGEADAHAPDPLQPPWNELGWLTTTAPDEALEQFGEAGRDWFLYLRANPKGYFSDKVQPLPFAKNKLLEAKFLYRSGQHKQALDSVLSAYLEGFELAEAAVKATSPILVSNVEKEMTLLRNLIKKQQDGERVEQQIALVLGLLDQAEEQLDSRKLSGMAAFTSSLIILLREGLEALLVVAALAAFLVKTGRRDAMRYLHIGWIGALVAGFITWYVATYIIAIGGAEREITEGIAALLAAVVLFYVGFWLHSKTPAVHWQRFIKESVDKALSAPTLWSLAGLSFISVYREAFETILFYQAIWTQAAGDGQNMILSGFVAAVVALLAIAWAMLRYGVRLPLRQFFSVTGIFLFVLATIFAGKGVVAMQEAGFIPVTPLEFNAIEILGLYPNAQGLVIQLLMVLLAVALLYRSQRSMAT